MPRVGFSALAGVLLTAREVTPDEPSGCVWKDMIFLSY